MTWFTGAEGMTGGLTWVTSGMMGRNGFWYCVFAVRASAPMVRPWNDPVNATISVGTSAFLSWASAPALTRAYFRANLIAPSFASVPELQKNTLSAKDDSTKRCASSTYKRRIYGVVCTSQCL